MLSSIDHASLTLAQNAASLVFHRVLPWLVAMLVLALVGGVLALYIRHRMLRDDDGPGVGMLEDLRRMRDSGDLSEDEYEQARLVMFARATGREIDDLKADAIRKAGGLVAEPGFDLTGRPLPKPPESGPDPEIRNTGPERNPDQGG